MWKAAGSFDAARAQPLTWLMHITHIARTRAIDSLRRVHTQPRRKSISRDEDDDRPDVADAMAGDAPGPLALLDAASDRRLLSACMERLIAPQRQSVALAFFNGLPRAEVAAQLREPLGSLKSWVRRTLATLRGCLDRAALHETVGVEEVA